MSVRKTPLPLGDGHLREAARMIGLSPDGFAEMRPQLHRRGFPLPDPDTGLYDLDAVNVWRKRRHPHLSFDDDDTEPEIDDGGIIYFVRAGSYLKIGFTTSLAQRLAALATYSPELPVLVFHEPGTQSLERHYHKRFGHLRMNGEWFRLVDDLAAFIATKTTEPTK